MNKNSKLDVLLIGAHSDDVDATVGGTVIQLVKDGYKVGILDLTKRSGMYFSEEEESGKENENAAKILGVDRQIIDLGLLRIENNYENRVRVADYVRMRQPDIVFTIGKDETHPDHFATHNLVLDALHYSFATAIKTANKPWRVKGIYFFPTNILYEKPPEGTIFVDISDTFEEKIEALKCYASQMLFHAHNKKYGLEFIESQNRAWGLLIGKEYAEVIIPRLPILATFLELRKGGKL